MLANEEYNIGFKRAIEQAAIGFVNLVKGLTGLTRVANGGCALPLNHLAALADSPLLEGH